MGAKYVDDSGDHSIELGGGDGRSFDAIQSSGVYLRDDGSGFGGDCGGQVLSRLSCCSAWRSLLVRVEDLRLALADRWLPKYLKSLTTSMPCPILGHRVRSSHSLALG